MTRAARLIVLLALVAGCGGGAKATQGPGDAQVQAIMAANLRDWSTSSWYPSLVQGAAGPDISYKGGLLIVATRLAGKTAAAEQMCRSIAAITNDPDTSKPLGVRKVLLIAGQTEITECDVPR